MPEVSKILRPSFKKKAINALEVDRVKDWLTFNPNKASLRETLYVAMTTLFSRRKQQSLILLFKCLNNNRPKFIKDSYSF